MALKKITVSELKRLNKLYGKFGRVLDVGCGDQLYRPYMAFNSYEGVDVELSGHNKENKKVDQFFDGENLPYPDSYFDFILCTEVLEHAKNPERLLFEIKRVLKKDGMILLTVPSMWGEHETPFDYRRYTSYGVFKLAEDLDLKIECYQKECPGVDSFVVLGISEINAGNNSVIKRIVSKFLLAGAYVLLKYIIRIDMKRIYLSNVIVLVK